jgi:ABC-type branched-subunit amino acid transport system permease subunit
MARIVLQVWGISLLIGILGALLGYGWELVTGQAGWALVLASAGLCGGAGYAGALVTRRAPPARRPAPAVDPPPPAATTE